MVAMLDKVSFSPGSHIYVWLSSASRDNTSASMTQHTDSVSVQTAFDIMSVVRVFTHTRIQSGLKKIYIKNQ